MEWIGEDNTSLSPAFFDSARSGELVSRLTAREHIYYYGQLHGLTGSAIDRRAGELIALLDMNEIADRQRHGHRKRFGVVCDVIATP